MNKNRYLYFFLPILLCLFFIIIALVKNNYTISPFLPFLPILYLLCLVIILAKKQEVFKSISALIILGTYFVRIVVIPAIYVLSGYSSKVSINSFNINDAILLQMWEFICVFIMILLSKKITNISKNKQAIVEKNTDRMKKITKFSIFLLIFLALICVIINKKVIVVVSTILNRFFDTQEEALARRIMYVEFKTESSVLFNLFLQSVYYLQILIPAFMISMISQKRFNKNNNKSKGFYKILLISLVSTFFVTENNIDSICIMLACLIVLYNLYENKMRKILPIIGAFFGVFVIMFLFLKVGLLTNEISFKEISEILCAYFAALPNIGIAFSMNYTDKMLTFFGDIISGVPYMMAVFKGYPQSLYIYNETLYGYKGISDQIMPMISYGYHYFGFLAPLLTIGTYILALHFEEKSNNSNSAFNKVLYSLMFINLSVGPCIFGFPNTIRRICLFIPLIILININEKKKRDLLDEK